MQMKSLLYCSVQLKRKERIKENKIFSYKINVAVKIATNSKIGESFKISNPKIIFKYALKSIRYLKKYFHKYNPAVFIINQIGRIKKCPGKTPGHNKQLAVVKILHQQWLLYFLFVVLKKHKYLACLRAGTEN